MAIAATNVYRTAYTFIADLTALDADATATNIAHGITAGTPNWATIQDSVSKANYSGWSVTLNATNAVVNKANIVGSGGTTPGTTVVARLIVTLPHSIL